MDKLEKIKTEYMLFERDFRPASLEEAQSLIGSYIDDMKDSRIGLRKCALENTINKARDSFMNIIARIAGYDPLATACYDEDTEILHKHRVLIDKYDSFFKQMFGSLSDDNYDAITRLAQFTRDNYLENYNYLESLRDGIEIYYNNGIEMICPGSESQDEFGEFYREEYANIMNSGKQYIKKD